MGLGQRLDSKKLLVIGDIMLDVYYIGDVSRISPEAPVPVFKKQSERIALGGAANVAANLAAARQQVAIMSITGTDSGGDEIIDALGRILVNCAFIRRTEERRTTVKTRFIASNNQHIMRLDVESSHPLSPDDHVALRYSLNNHIRDFDIVVLSDYLKGVLTHEFTREIIYLSSEAGIPVIADVKDSNFQKYTGAFLLKPNLSELQKLTGSNAKTYDEIKEASVRLCHLSKCKYILTTCGERGMVLVEETGECSIIPSKPIEVYDVTGAGDTVLAYLGACLANGFNIWEAAFNANIAAGIQVSKRGTVPVDVYEVDEWIRKNAKDDLSGDKIIDRLELLKLRKCKSEKTIVFTDGCYDILHIGHVSHLRQAAKLGDILVVGVNSDASIRRLKGENCPINTQTDRAEFLAALEFVDYVIIFEEETLYEIISELKPDVLVKSADHEPGEVIGRDLVEANGGRLVLISLVEARSARAIAEEMSEPAKNTEG